MTPEEMFDHLLALDKAIEQIANQVCVMKARLGFDEIAEAAKRVAQSQIDFQEATRCLTAEAPCSELPHLRSFVNTNCKITKKGVFCSDSIRRWCRNGFRKVRPVLAEAAVYPVPEEALELIGIKQPNHHSFYYLKDIDRINDAIKKSSLTFQKAIISE